MARNHATRREFVLIKCEGFAGDEMDGNRVGAEGVEDNHGVGGVGCGCERQAGITEDDAQIGGGIAEKREGAFVACELFDDRINLVVGPRLPRQRITRE